MKRLFAGAMVLALGIIPAAAQSLDDLNIQIHGFTTQGFLYTTNNNVLATTSSNGSPAWTEAVVNVSSLPTPKLRVAIQARYELLGNYSNAITIDYAEADYKFSDKFGVRFGKVKTPSGLFNEIQDIDPSYIWALLPQSIYPISSRNSQLSHYGGVVYGTVSFNQAGKLDYRAWGGERVLAGDDGYFFNQTEGGTNLPYGLSAITYGGTLSWRTPLPGLMVGITMLHQNESSATLTGAINGAEQISKFNRPSYFAKYEKGKVMIAAEQNRVPLTGALLLGAPIPPIKFSVDDQAWYVMASYKVTGKFTVGAYDSQVFDRGAGRGPTTFSKDWVVSGRYDLNQYLYAKVEQHFIDGTLNDYDTTLNPAGLKPSTKLTVLKIGVSF